MERTRESRRSSMATSTNGFLRRRNRTIALRDSSEEGAVELREAANKRGRNRDRDRDSLNRNKRRRGSHSHRDEGEQSTDESVGNEQDDVVSASRMRFSNTTSFASDLNHRRSLTTLKVTDEMIGVAVPRKARSVSVKRSYEGCVSAGGGGGGGGREDHNFRQPSSSPARHSLESVSPSSSSVSIPKKMKTIGAALKTSKSSSSDIEIEIAELLYGWRTSKKHESSSSQKPEASTDHQTSLPPRNTSPSSCPSEDVEKKKMKDYTSSAPVKSDSTAELVRIQSGQPASVDCHDGSATGHGNGSSEAPKEDTGEVYLKSSVGCGDVTADGRSDSPTGEWPLCSKLGVDREDSASVRGISAVPEAKSQRVSKFEIDLMAPPPMMFPEGDDLSRGDFTLETKAFALDVEMKREDNCFKVEEKVEGSVKKERTPEESEEAKKVVFREEGDMLKHDLEKPNNDNGDTRTNTKLDEHDRNKDQATASSNSKVQKTAQSSFAPLSTTVSGWPPTGYMLPLQTVVKMDKTVGSSATPQYVNFVLSPPRPKRCATHHHIARNIFLHQQFTKTNPLLPAAIGSSFLGDTKANDVNCIPSAESMVIGKLSQKHLPGVNQKAAQEKESAATSDPSLTTTKSSNNLHPMDSTQRMQLVLQQSPHPSSTGNQMHGPAFLFSPGQHQASVAAASSQAGVNSTCSASSHNKSHSLAAGSLGTSSMSPAVGTAMSFSYPKFSTNDTPPYVTIVQNNGYSFPLSTSLGATAAIRGASPAQASHVLNGPFYSTQMFHPLQHQQHQPHSQALIQPSYISASTSSSSSSHKLSQGAQVNCNNTLTSTTMQSQQSQKLQNSLSHPRKHETEMSGENAPSIANRTSYHQKSVQEQNYTIQPVNFSFTPSASDIVGSNGGNFGDKQQQQQSSKGGVEIIPSQAFAISFAAFNGTNVPSNLNFSSMPQNPVIFHSLPDIAWQGYQAASTSHTIPQKAYSITEGKSGGNSSRQDVEKKTIHGKSSTYGPTTLVFDNSSKNLNFVLSPTNGNWPSRSITSTAVTSVPLSSNASSSQQSSQLLQLQKQHGMQQQQPAMATRCKASSSNTNSATKFANNAPAFSQTLTQCKSSSQGSHYKSSGRNIDSHIHHSSIISSNTASLKSFSMEQGRVSQGHMEISFGGNYITSLPPQGQELLNNNQPLCATVAGTPINGGNLKPNSEGRKVGSAMNTSQSQQTENSSAGSGQKSSPVCGRNVPSILSSCPGHLSELKY